ncbi:hypothetical protein BC834DRAFT_140202 [Gloeopeniophorella convolvens]|nr:hypothetical protein BC834DRAFT_140202 [Gloeopeniophorella convolvens]
MDSTFPLHTTQYTYTFLGGTGSLDPSVPQLQYWVFPQDQSPLGLGEDQASLRYQGTYTHNYGLLSPAESTIEGSGPRSFQVPLAGVDNVYTASAQIALPEPSSLSVGLGQYHPQRPFTFGEGLSNELSPELQQIVRVPTNSNFTGPPANLSQQASPHVAGPSTSQPTEPTSQPRRCRRVVVDQSQLLPCCFTVKPQSLARHMVSKWHRRMAGLPALETDKCPLCGRGFSRPDPVGRHLATQHGEDEHDMAQGWLNAIPPAKAAFLRTMKKKRQGLL